MQPREIRCARSHPWRTTDARGHSRRNVAGDRRRSPGLSQVNTLRCRTCGMSQSAPALAALALAALVLALAAPDLAQVGWRASASRRSPGTAPPIIPALGRRGRACGCNRSPWRSPSVCVQDPYWQLARSVVATQQSTLFNGLAPMWPQQQPALLRVGDALTS